MPKTLSEFGLIGKIRKLQGSGKRPQGVLTGIGDDAAVLTPPKSKLVVTTDMLVEGVHFRRDWMTLSEIGYKAMAVNLSDMAAMGADPLWAFVSVAIPRTANEPEALELFRGLRRRAEEDRVVLAGGDTNAGPVWVVNVAVIGEGTSPVLRSGARAGDVLYVTGALGGAALGLEALKKYARRRMPRRYRQAVRCQVSPPNRVGIGKLLRGFATSLIDLSDGLLGDLGHVMEESGVGAEVESGCLPLARHLNSLSASLGRDALLLAFSGGEDYELLFTASPRTRVPGKIAGVPVTKIGRMLPRREGLVVVGAGGRRTPVVPGAFTHF